MNLYFPHMTQFEESQRGLERDFQLRQQIRAARAASHAKRTISLRSARDAPAPLAAARTAFSPRRRLLADFSTRG